MSHVQASSRQSCCLLAVLCGKFADRPRQEADGKPSYPFPQLVSSGRLEVHTLVNPNVDKFRDVQKSLEPNFLYCQGEQLEYEDEIGSFVLGDTDVSNPEMFSSLMDTPLPTIVYLEVPNSEKVAQALQSKGVPYVIYWKNPISTYAASHFRQALLSVIQSSCCHTWDAFQLANASFRLYYVQNNHVSPGQQASSKLGPCLLGDAPKVNIIQPEKDPDEEEERSSDDLPAIKIYDEGVDVKFLICGVPCALDAFLLGSLEDGLNALLNIEIRGSKLRNRVSAGPPPPEAGTFSSDVVTMRCDLTTCSYAHISLLVSRSSQTCFSDQVLERHIKKELIEKNQLVYALPNCQESKPALAEPRNSEAIAYGASVFEVCMKVPTWASQVLRQLAPQVCFRSLVTLGISSIQGTSVASFEKEDVDRLLFFCTGQGTGVCACTDDSYLFGLPRWACSHRKGSLTPDIDTKQIEGCKFGGANGNSSEQIREDDKKLEGLIEGTHVSTLPSRLMSKTAALRPIPRLHQHKILPFLGTAEADSYNGNLLKHNMPIIPSGKRKLVPAAPTTQRKSISSSLQAQQIISLNPLPMKKHGCDRCPIQVCSEEEFLKDVMQFLILKGHGRLVPRGGISEFPDAILNAKRLDLFSLYREVVSRGGFYVGNGINWKGQVFSKMRNHTTTNKMTGVGNTLKRHYETYLLKYELAHDDVDGECCLLCHSSAPGDWVNCGLCGEWAHFGCDRRPGLGTFKDYAKTGGLEYVCPHCSLTNCKRKQQKLMNGFSNRSTAARHL